MPLFNSDQRIFASVLMLISSYARRFYWTRQFKRDPDGATQVVLTRFHSYLLATPPMVLMRNGQRRQAPTLSSVTIGGYVRILKKVMRDERTVFPSHRQVVQWINSLKAANKSWSHITNSTSALEWLMRFWGQPIRVARPRKPLRVAGDVLGEDEVSMLFKVCRGLRDRAVLSIFFVLRPALC